MELSLGELAASYGCELRGDPDSTVRCVATLEHAGEGALAFLANPHYLRFLETTRATCVILREESLDRCPVAALVHPDPYLIYAQAAGLLYPPPPVDAGVHPSAVVAPDCDIDSTAQIGPLVSIGRGCRIGPRVVLAPGCVIGDSVQVGEDTRIHPNVTIHRGTVIGRRCVIHAGAVVGSDGFGYAPSPEGWVPVPQIGLVRIGDDVDVGSNTCIDRGAIGDTVLDDGVKLDNMVQIAHNVRVGAHTAMAAQVGISGSTVIGRWCMFAGHSGTVGHISVCDNVVISGKTMVTKNITKPGQYGAALPAEEMRQYRRTVARIRQLDKMADRLAAVEKSIARGGDNDD